VYALVEYVFLKKKVKKSVKCTRVVFEYVYHLYKRYEINKKRQVASHYLDS